MTPFSRRFLKATTIVIASGVCLAGCSERRGGQLIQQTQDETAVPKRDIEAVQRQMSDEWMKIAGVVGTAIGLKDGRPCIKVYVQSRTPALEKVIPQSVEGFPVHIEVTGPINALDRRK